MYSLISNNSTGTIEKNPPKSLAVLSFSCGTIGKNYRCSPAVLLFEWYYNLIIGLSGLVECSNGVDRMMLVLLGVPQEPKDLKLTKKLLFCYKALNCY